MPISPHLQRKLREALGPHAGEDVVNMLEVAQATRGDIAELRHEMELRFASQDGKFAELRAGLDGKLAELRSGLETAIERDLKEQTRFFFLAWAVILAAVGGLCAR